METKTIGQLRKEANAIYSVIREMEKAEFEEEATKALGRYFTKPNSYGSGPKWVVYFLPVSVKDLSIVGMSFQTDCFGRIEVEPQHCHIGDMEGWKEITQEEFEDAYSELAATILHLAAT